MRTLWQQLEEIVGAVLLALVGIVVAIQVLYRFVVGDPLSWTQECATILFIYAVFFGASLALKRREHFALELVADALPHVPQTALRVVDDLLVLAFMVCLLVWGVIVTGKGWHTVTPALELPRSVPYAAVPLGAFLMLVRSGEQLVSDLQRFRRPAAEDAS
jgi:TRAP-type C4-dicarboxylate transport system permease small subunit